MFTLKAINIPDAWFQLCYNIFDNGFTYLIDRGSFQGNYRLEYDFVALEITNPGLRPLFPDFPMWMNCDPPVTEEYINNYFLQLLDPDVPKNTVYTYGMYLTPQIAEIINIFRKHPRTNQCCATIGNIDLIYLDDPPCLKVLDFRLKENTLHMYIYFRSNDLYAGFPVNIAGLQLLKEYMCSLIGCKDGPIYYSSKGLHLYDYQFDIVRRRTGNASFIFENSK
jgi:thymidylate synthase